MKTPNKVNKGNEVRIVSTARAISKLEIAFAIKTLSSWGLTVSVGKSLYKVDHQFAGNTEQRIWDLQEAINDKNVKAVLFARGGYGSVKVVDEIDFSPLLSNPKWLVGYSDITVLHSHLNRQVGVMSLHATMPINFHTNTTLALETLRNCMHNGKNSLEVENHILNRQGTGQGQLVGGNLSILYSLMGSPSDIDTKGRILFIEDLDEYLYHIDRMMMNLKRSGKLKQLSGLVVGGLTKMNDNEIPFGKNAQQIVMEAVAEYDYPVAFDFPAGHIEDNRSLYFGAKSKLVVNDKVVVLEQII